jgi:hypothetical protein
MANPYVTSGYVQEGYVDGAPLATPILQFALAGPERMAGRTAYGQAPFAIQYAPGGGPYATQLVFALGTWYGTRTFSNRAIADTITFGEIERRISTMDWDDLVLAGAPLSPDLLSSLDVTERPQARVVFPNLDRWWSRLLASEPVLFMVGTQLIIYDQSTAAVTLAGQIQTVRLRKRTCELIVGEP